MDVIDQGLLGRNVKLVAAATFKAVADRNLVGLPGVIRGVHSLDGAGYTSTWFLVEVWPASVGSPQTDPPGGPSPPLSPVVYLTVPEQCIQSTPVAPPVPGRSAGWYPPEYMGAPPVNPIPEKPA